MEKINLQSSQIAGKTLCSDGNITLINNLMVLRDMPDDILLDGFLLSFVIAGEAIIRVDSKSYELSAGNIFACTPQHLLTHSMLSMDIKVRALFIRTDYSYELASMTHLDWTQLRLRQSHRVAKATEEEMAQFLEYFNLLHTKMTMPPMHSHRQSLDALIVSLSYMIHDILKRCNNDEEIQPILSSSQSIMNRFGIMLKDKPYLNVNGYADRLNINPRYFSSVCKKATGKTAGELINEKIIHSAKILLREGHLSIKQIADQLGFANQSHFGTFFRRHVGVSPQQYISENPVASAL